MLGYLPPVLPNQPDSVDRGHGKKTHLACHQLDYTCRIVDTAFAAEVDVTGVVNDIVLRRVGRFHRRELRLQTLKRRLGIPVRLRFDGHEFPPCWPPHWLALIASYRRVANPIVARPKRLSRWHSSPTSKRQRLDKH